MTGAIVKPEPLLLTALDVAQLLRLDSDFPDDAKSQIATVQRLHRAGKLRGVAGVGKALRWRMRDVQTFCDGLNPGENT